MADAIYPKAKEAFLQGEIAMQTDTLKVMLVDNASYTYNAAHEFLSDVPVGARVSTSAALTGKTFVNGVFDADDTSLAGNSTEAESIIIFQDTTVAATSRLIYYNDSAAAFPIVTSGNISVAWDNGPNKIFKL